MNRRESIRRDLVDIYGEQKGEANYAYLIRAVEEHKRCNGAGVDTEGGAGSPSFDRLAGKVFAICYPDNVYNDSDPTLMTLREVLRDHFPAINGIHILPERLMSHDDIWPQDLLSLLPAHLAGRLIEELTKEGVLASDRTVADARAEVELGAVLARWYTEHAAAVKVEKTRFIDAVGELVASRRNYHFNDGGFSQISRARVDPRFGEVEELKSLSGSYALMLDYVVNHLDIDNETLEAYRRGENDGTAFIIISPEEYEQRKQNGDIAKTFRPRPFPLFTGLRKYPPPGAGDMKTAYEDAGLVPPDERVTRFLSIYFKIRNDQGLSKQERRILDDLIDFLLDAGIDACALFRDSEIHEGQPALTKAAAEGMERFCELAGIGADYAKVFDSRDDEIYGEKFFVYTTFSESQADINPVSEAGFRLIVDDLFHILKSGELTMMRMDAVKYLWKEIGKRNFDMEEGNKLNGVIRQTLSLVAPDLIPLDEVNSADQEVYRMGRDGGFAYLFGQVNALPAAFNTGSLKPLERLTQTMKEKCPDDLTLFVMLSTHDGRSVQGIGVDRPDGHVSIGVFSELRKTVEAGGGRVKYRGVPAGRIPAGTFEKVCAEMGVGPGVMGELFRPSGDEYVLKETGLDREGFENAVLKATGKSIDDEGFMEVFDFLADWVVAGRTAYELCCTSRASFDAVDRSGKPLTPVEEAHRLALAQIFVLSFGQSVPAVYFNDLLGLMNDTAGYRRSGEPRDLNRHKSHRDEIRRALEEDEFTRTYVPLINAAIAARTADRAFHPASRGYEFVCPVQAVFLNHAFTGSHHSLVIGNIAREETRVSVDLTKLKEPAGGCKMTDRLTGKRFQCAGDGVDLTLPAYGAFWLSLPEG